MKRKRSETPISIPVIRWKCPQQVVWSPNWLLACGEQSSEVVLQKQREVNVFEAVYPFPSDIPLNPSGAFCEAKNLTDDSMTPLISLTPVEDRAIPQPLATLEYTPSGTPNTTRCSHVGKMPAGGGNQGINLCGDADAASAALTVLLKSNKTGSTIDTNLLIEILSNPEMVAQLLNWPSFEKPLAAPKNNSKQVLPSAPLSCPSSDTLVPSTSSAPASWGGAQMASHCAPIAMQPKYIPGPILSAEAAALPPPPPQISRVQPYSAPLPMPSTGNRSQVSLMHGATSQPTVNLIKPLAFASSQVSYATTNNKVRPCSTPIKDANYYKNLVKEHGMNNPDFHPYQSLPELTGTDIGKAKTNSGLSSKNLKHCMYFSTPRGCRRGLECPFVHDMTAYHTQAGNMAQIPKS